MEHGKAVLSRLMLESCIFSAADRAGIRLERDELAPFQKQTKSAFPLSDQFEAASRELRARLLLRKLVLKDYPETKIRELFEILKEDLESYDVMVILTRERSKALEAIKGLDSAYSFESQFEKYDDEESLKSTRGHLGYLTRVQIARRFGLGVADAAEKLAPNTFGKIPFAGSAGFLVLRVGHIRATYGELRTKIQDLIVQAHGDELLLKLQSQSRAKTFATGQVSSATIFEQPILTPFGEEGPPVVGPAPSSTPSAQIGSDVGRHMGLPVPALTPSDADQPVGGFVGSDMGTKIPDPKGPRAWLKLDPTDSPSPANDLPHPHPNGTAESPAPAGAPSTPPAIGH